jgi:hypothetical protein
MIDLTTNPLSEYEKENVKVHNSGNIWHYQNYTLWLKLRCNTRRAIGKCIIQGTMLQEVWPDVPLVGQQKWVGTEGIAIIKY